MIKKRDEKRKFNIVDGFVVLLAVICIASIVNKALVIGDKYESNKPVDCKVMFVIENIDEVKQSVVDNLKSGDAVVIQPNAIEFGTVDGEITYTDDRQAAYVNLLVCGVIEKEGLRLNDNTLLSVGDEVEIATELVQVTLKVVAIQQ